MDVLTAAVVALALITLVHLSASAGLYRRIRELELATYEGIGRDLTRGAAPKGVEKLVRPGVLTIVMKINRRCPVCEQLIAAASRIGPSLDSSVRLAVLSDDPGYAADLPETVQVLRDPDVWRAVSTPYVPAILVVDGDGKVVHTAPGGSESVLEDIVEKLKIIQKEAA